MTTIKGIDIASHQGPNFPFARARAEGYEFAIIKGAGGHGYKNPYRGAQAAAARAAGMAVGWYHYMFEPMSGGGDVEAEATNFRDAILPYCQAGDTIWLDVEEYPAAVGFSGDLGAWIDTWCDMIADWFRATVGIYCATWYIDGAGLGGDQRLVKRPYWMASWQLQPPTEPFRRPWRVITMWQYDAFGAVGGVKPIDEDLFFGTREQLAALGIDGAAPAAGDPWAYLKVPFGPFGHTVHPYFHADYALEKYGYPLGPAAAYSDGGTIRQLFERGVWRSNGRGEPVAEALGQALAHMTGRNVADWPDVHPLLG